MTDDNLVLHTRVVTGGGGGPEKTIINSPRFLRDEGYPMLCAYMRDPKDKLFSDLLTRAEAKQATILPVDDGGPFDWKIAGRLLKICQEHQPVFWHGHDYKSNALGLWVRRKVPLRLVTTVHGWVQKTWKTPLYYAIDKASLRRYEHVICVSQDLYDEVRSLGVSEDRCTHIPNGIDTEEYKRTRSVAESKERLGTTSKRLVIGAVGRLSAEKGFHLLLEAFSRVRQELKLDAELWIVGEGTEEQRLQHLVEELGLCGHAKLLGFRKDTIDLFHAMDLFVLSSIREGLPNVVLEAMALEVPVLSTKVAGVPTLIKDRENGLLVDTGSMEALLNGLREVLKDEVVRSRYAAAGRRTIEDSFSFALRMQRVKQVYDKVLARDTAQG